MIVIKDNQLKIKSQVGVLMNHSRELFIASSSQKWNRLTIDLTSGRFLSGRPDGYIIRLKRSQRKGKCSLSK
jgi:hypothetical protein